MSVFSAVNLGPPVFGFVGAIANGTTQATATLVTAQVTVFTSVVSGGAAVLPAANATMSSVTVFNASSNALLVYPPVGGNIYPNATNAATTISAGLSATFSCFDPAVSGSLNWYVLSAISTGNFLPIPGGTLTGPLHMGANTIDGSAVAFTGGTINNVPIGGVTPAAGAFTTVVSGSGSNNILTITPGSTTATATTFAASGTGDLNFLTATNHTVLTLRDATSAVNSVRVSAGATGAGVTLQQAGDATGTLKLGAGTSGTAGLVSALTPMTVSGGVQFGKALTYTAGSAITGVTPTGNSAVLWYNSSLTGTLNTGSGVPFLIQIADSFNGGTSNASIFNFTENLNTGYDGNRQSINWVINKTAAAATPAGPSGAGWLNTAFSIYQHIDAGDGGTAAAPYGQNTMFNPDLRVNTGDWVFSAINTEADLRVFSGTNTPQKVIHAFHYGIGDGSHASPKTGDPTLAYQDSAITIDASPSIGNGSGKGLTTIQFGSFTQDTPWDSTVGVGTSIMRAWLNCAGNLSAAQQVYIDNGFNLPEVYVRGKFIDNGLFRVDGPTGNIATGLATVAATSTGSSIDVTGVVAVSATVASGGSSAKVGAEIIDSQGGLWEVATLSGSAAATVTLKRAAAVSAAPANPVTCRMANSTAAVTLNITWSSARSTLTLQPSGGSTAITGAVGFNGTAPVAKPNVTGSKGANAALASLLTALASYGLVTDSTT